MMPEARLLHILVGIAPVLLYLAAALCLVVAFMPRHVPARSSSQIREARRQ